MTGKGRMVSILGVPTSAGSHNPGQEKAPAARYPLLRPGQVVLFGFDPAELDTMQWTELVCRHLYAAPAPAVRANDPDGRLIRTLASMVAGALAA